MKRIYLDHASVAPLDPRVRLVMEPWLHGAWNASALHAEGRTARAALDFARRRLAEVWQLKPRQILFTASGSESVALAILGTAMQATQPGILWTTRAEHSCVLRCADVLQARGWQIQWIPVDEDGQPNLTVLEEQLQTLVSETRIVSLMFVNNEIGTIHPIMEAARIAHKHRAIFHCDAIASGEVIEFREILSHVDMLSLAAQKCGGPLGAGVLVRRELQTISALIPGGAQEMSLRSGTENIAAIVGAAEAFCLRELEVKQRAAHAAMLQSHFERLVLSHFQNERIRIQSHATLRSPALTHLAFADLDGPALLAAADLRGLALSAGSACEAGALTRSHVADAIGLDRTWTALLRFSWGTSTTIAEVDEAVKRLVQIVFRMREVQAI